MGYETTAKDVYKDMFELQNLSKERERFVREIIEIDKRMEFLRKRLKL